jgi:ABC-type uncharacterized transport system permease subunit
VNPSSLVLFLYVGALAFALLFGGFRHKGLFTLSAASAAGGGLIHTWVLGSYWIGHGVPPAVNLHQLFETTAWAVLVLYFLLLPLTRSRILVFFVMPLVNLSYLMGLMVPDTAVEPKPLFLTPWFAVHIFLLIFGISFFFLSFLYAAIFIMQDHSLRRRHNPLILPLPSLEEAERWCSRLLLLGYPLFSLGMFSSIAYGISYGRTANYRPGLLEGASVLAWLVLGIAVYGWLTAKVHPRRRSWLVVAGAAFSLLILFGIIWH